MKTSFNAKVIIDSDKYNGFSVSDRKDGKAEINLNTIKEEVNKGHYVIEWINSDLDNYIQPIIIIKI